MPNNIIGATVQAANPSQLKFATDLFMLYDCATNMRLQTSLAVEKRHPQERPDVCDISKWAFLYRLVWADDAGTLNFHSVRVD